MSSIRELLSEQGLTLLDADPAKCGAPAPVLALCERLADNYPVCLTFLKYIRSCLSNKTARCTFPLASIPEEERPATQALARELENCGLLADLFIKPGEMIRGTFPLIPRVNEFLTGDFLEIYAAGTAARALKEAAEARALDWELLANAVVEGLGESHELDLLFRAGSCLFWCEVKSGHFSDYGKYYRIGRWLGVHPDRYLLLTAEKTSSSCETISYFYEFHVSNIQDFPGTLSRMLEHALDRQASEDASPAPATDIITHTNLSAAPAAERTAL